MLISARLQWFLLAFVLPLSSLVIITNVEAAIEITVTSPDQKVLTVAEPVVTVPKPLEQKKLRTRSISGSTVPIARMKNLMVNGYRDNTFVYGELKTMPDGVIEGYLYSDRKPIYVYGELRRQEQIIQAYDSEGKLYVLEIIKK